MNSRERFNAAMHGQPVDHLPDFEFWWWDATLERWVDEGLPADLTPTACPDRSELHEKLVKYFDLEMIHGVPVKTRFIREPRAEVIAEDETRETVRNEIGEEWVRFKPGHGESIPTHIRHAVETRDDWLRVRDEYMPLTIEGRLPQNWDELRRQYAGRQTILNSPQMGFYGFLRNLMGVENISIAIALEPEWVEEMMEHLLQIYLLVIRRIIDDGVQMDISGWWEDMCFSTGPLISPEMFDRYMVPRYRQVTDLMRQAGGCDRAVVDSDGNIHKLAPLWYKAGVNILLPCEAAHTDTLKLRRENPQADLILMGGVDKKALARGRAAIDVELERIRRVMEAGPLVPHVDHLVPPDVSFADYMYYREKKQRLIGK
jgi:hypothetical protein